MKAKEEIESTAQHLGAVAGAALREEREAIAQIAAKGAELVAAISRQKLPVRLAIKKQIAAFSEALERLKPASEKAIAATQEHLLFLAQSLDDALDQQPQTTEGNER